jgi:hypothetical protein
MLSYRYSKYYYELRALGYEKCDIQLKVGVLLLTWLVEGLTIGFKSHL